MLVCFLQSLSHANETIDRATMTEALVIAGKRYEQAGQYEQARRAFQYALAEDPSHAEAAAALERIERLMQRREESIMAAIRAADSRRKRLTAAPPQGEAIRGEAEVSAPLPANQVAVAVNGERVTWEQPGVLRGGRPLIPLRAMAALRYVGLVQAGPDTFELLFPDGVEKQATISWIGTEPMLTESQVRDLFFVDTWFDPILQVLEIRTPDTPEVSTFQTYTIPKPEEDVREEAFAKAVLEQQTAPPPDLTGEIPHTAQPWVDLHGTVSYAYRHRHGAAPDRSVITSLSGRAYDFEVRGESTRKDLSGIFDHDYSYLNFNRPELFMGLFDQFTDLLPLRGQSERFNGLKIRSTWDQATTTTLLGGDTETTTSGPSGSVKYLGHVYQASQAFLPLDWLRWRSAVVYVENEADLPSQSGTTGLPRENLVAFTDVEIEPFQDVSVSGQLARATYRPDRAPDDTVGDWDWRASSVVKKDRGQFGVTYEFVGDRYASIGNPALYQDFQGWNAFGNYRLTKSWLLSSHLLRYRNNVDDDPDRITQDNQALFLSSSWQLPWQHTATLSWNDFLTDPSGPNPGSSSRSSVYRVDYALPFFLGSHLVTNYQHVRTRQPAASDSASHGVGGTLFKGFLGGSSLHLSQQFTASDAEATADAIDATTSLSLNYQCHRDLGFYANSSYTRQMTEGAEGLDTLAGSAGMRWQLAPNTAFTSEYRIDSYALDTERGHWPQQWSLLFLVTQGMEFFSQPTFGMIEGWIWKDLNGDGRLQAGEPRLDDVTVRLDTGRETLTNAQGHFGLTRVTPGRHTVTIDVGNIPTEWMLRVREQTVDVKRSGRARLSFPLIQAASIRGRVFIDENADGRFQDVEEPLEGIAVIVWPGEQFRRSDADGLVHFDYLMPGRYRLQLHRDDLPVGYALVSEDQIDLTRSAGEQGDEVPFAVRLVAAPSLQSQ